MGLRELQTERPGSETQLRVSSREERGEPRTVWGRRQVQSQECPKSFVTGDSMALLEEYFVGRRLGIPDSLDTEARKADAFLILRDLMEGEERRWHTQH